MMEHVRCCSVTHLRVNACGNADMQTKAYVLSTIVIIFVWRDFQCLLHQSQYNSPHFPSIDNI